MLETHMLDVELSYFGLKRSGSLLAVTRILARLVQTVANVPSAATACHESSQWPVVPNSFNSVALIGALLFRPQQIAAGPTAGEVMQRRRMNLARSSRSLSFFSQKVSK